MLHLTQTVAGLLLATAALTACGSEDVGLSSSCGDYFELDQADRHDAAQRLSIEAQADSPGGPFWGLKVDDSCGSLGSEAQLRQAFGLEPVAEGQEDSDSGDGAPDAIALERLETAATGLESCRLFSPRDYFDMFGELPADITTSGNSGFACEYRVDGNSSPALSIGEVCAEPTRTFDSGLNKNRFGSATSPIETFREQYPDRASVGGQGTRTNEFGSLALIRGDCVISVSAPGLDDDTKGRVLQLAAERA